MCKYHATQLCLAAFVVFTGLCLWPANASAADSSSTSRLRSAYLGNSVWPKNLSAREINDQVKDHFAAAIEQLEARNASSLLTALIRLEQTSEKRWTQVDRRNALISLARNRRVQINRIRDYMNRGLFPLNEGQSPDDVPVFVDRHDTRCAVANLMHLDRKDIEVDQIVNTNNLVRVGDVERGSIMQWTRTSGMTHEEVAMVQPCYPCDYSISLNPFLSEVPTSYSWSGDKFEFSDATIRSTSYVSRIPSSRFQDYLFDPSLQDIVFAEAEEAFDYHALLPFDEPVGMRIGHPHGFYFGSDIFFDLPRGRDWVYLGSNNQFNPLIEYSADQYLSPRNVKIIEIDYRIQSNPDFFDNPNNGNVEFSHFSNFTLRADGEALGEGSAIFVLSHIYSGSTDQLLGTALQFAAGGRTPTGRPTFEVLSENPTTPILLSEDSLRIKTFGLATVSDTPRSYTLLSRIFHEFEVTEVPTSSSLGDCNEDGNVDFLDINPFIQVMASDSFLAQADCNEDGTVNFLDIAPFLAILAGG